jgi:hypothetical protein
MAECRLLIGGEVDSGSIVRSKIRQAREGFGEGKEKNDLNMKKNHLIDLMFIVLLALILVMISEFNLRIKSEFLFIPFLICYYTGRYVTKVITRGKK